MTLTLNLPPDLEARLIAAANKRGLAVEDVVVPLVRGFLGSDSSEWMQDGHRQKAEREVNLIKSLARRSSLSERAAEALCRETNLRWQMDFEQRIVTRCEREALLAKQSGDVSASLKAFQRKVMHEKKIEELRPQVSRAAEKASQLREKLQDSEKAVHTSMVELLRMKIDRRRALIQFGISGYERGVTANEAAQIHKQASPPEWERMYAQWSAEVGDTTPEEAPSELEVMEQINANTDETIQRHLQRLAQISQRNGGMSPPHSETPDNS